MDIYAHQAKKIQEQTRQIIGLDKELEFLRAQVAELKAENERLRDVVQNRKEQLTQETCNGLITFSELKRQRDEYKADADRMSYLLEKVRKYGAGVYLPEIYAALAATKGES